MLELKLNRVSRHYKKKIAVDQVDAVFTRGVYGLLGANGAGKTTLLRMLSCILRPTSGEILLNGKEIGAMGGDYRRLLGYLPQDFGYYPEFTARRYMMYLAELKAVPEDLAVMRTKELLFQTGLEAKADRKIRTFSGGMIRRLGIAQALLNEPRILILDEPTSGLDPKERIRFRNLISSLGRERIVLLSSHIVTDLECIAQEIVLMKDGRFIKKDRPEKLLKEVEGKIWEVTVDEPEAERFLKPEHLLESCTVCNMKNENGRVRLRLLCEKQPGRDAVCVTPELEDVYLYYFGESGEAQ